MTNLGKTREEIIYELLLSISKGNVGYYGAKPKVNLATEYYKELEEKGIVYEVEDKLDEKDSDKAELPLVRLSLTPRSEKMYVNDMQVLDHKNLYATDILNALDGLGIIKFTK